MKIKIWATVVALVTGMPFIANAAVWNYEGALNFDQSVGATGIPSPYFGGGLVNASFDDASGLFSWNFTYAGLTGDALFAHFHVASSGATGPVAITVIAPPGAPTAGTFAGDIETATIAGGLSGAITELTGDGTLSPGDEAGWYLNIHTDANMSGELRSQLFVTSVVPVPAALWLAVPALGFLARARRSA